MILQAATTEFGLCGYDAASIKTIARRAQVAPALVHHYFPSKAELFGETVRARLRPAALRRRLLASPSERLGRELARTVLESFEAPDAAGRALAILRTALGHEFAAAMLRDYLTDVLSGLARELHTPDAEVRSAVAAAQLVGLLLLRHSLKVSAATAASVDDLVDLIGPTLQRYLRPA